MDGITGMVIVYLLSIFMYMHYNHCHQATAHLQLNIHYYYNKGEKCTGIICDIPS